MQDTTYYLSPFLAPAFKTDAPLSRLFLCWRVRSRTFFIGDIHIQAGRTWLPRNPRSLHEHLPVLSSRALGCWALYISQHTTCNELSCYHAVSHPPLWPQIREH